MSTSADYAFRFQKTKSQHTLAIKLPERLACDRGIGELYLRLIGCGAPPLNPRGARLVGVDHAGMPNA
jgi:hypothetical protein